MEEEGGRERKGIKKVLKGIKPEFQVMSFYIKLKRNFQKRVKGIILNGDINFLKFGNTCFEPNSRNETNFLPCCRSCCDVFVDRDFNKRLGYFYPWKEVLGTTQVLPLGITRRKTRHSASTAVFILLVIFFILKKNFFLLFLLILSQLFDGYLPLLFARCFNKFYPFLAISSDL